MRGVSSLLCKQNHVTFCCRTGSNGLELDGSVSTLHEGATDRGHSVTLSRSLERRVGSKDNSEEEDEEGTSSDMETEKEKMLALLQNFTTTIDASSMSINIESLPHTRIHSSSNLHSIANSARSSTTNIPRSGSFQFGSINSFTTSANVTPLLTKKFPGPPESDAGTDLLNICRICQLPGSDCGDDILFSACRCSGSLKYVHDSCLLRWIEYSTRKTKKPPMCELCLYPYTRHKRFKFSNWRWPKVSRRDKCLHIIFLLTLVIMVACAVATVMCFLSDSGQISQTKSQLSVEEVITLTCGVLFFVSFFLAMTVEIRARHTVYRLIQKFITHNTEWQIEPYDKAKDPNCPKPYLYV